MISKLRTLKDTIADHILCWLFPNFVKEFYKADAERVNWMTKYNNEVQVTAHLTRLYEGLRNKEKQDETVKVD